ncbi:MAG: hypothetical protein RBS17_09570, partial [Coriobacteriia bacterium]|nr:hypothetical protein [Coriobacteriia bacterium]
GLFRSTIPIRPSKWYLMPGLLRSVPERSGTIIRGFQLGLSKRRDVWSRRAVSRVMILRWLIKGTGPL